MQPNLEKISATIQQFFGEQVESIARRTKFVQRRSKLTGCVFLASIVFSILEKREMTLSSLAQSCLDVGVEITEQGLDRRINAGSQAFLAQQSTAQRQQVLLAAYEQDPQRFAAGIPKPPQVPEAVWINLPIVVEATNPGLSLLSSTRLPSSSLNS